MRRIQVEVSGEFEAPADMVYRILADYRNGHPAILPKAYFKELSVEGGGTGAGTIFRLTMNSMGAILEFRQIVSEPEPGRVLVESEVDGDVVTTFTVDPRSPGERSHVMIQTDKVKRPRLIGRIEALPIPGLLRRIYRAELDQLAAYVAVEKA